jgi:hypothetical protein
MNRYTEKAHIRAAEHRRALAELNQLAADIGRCQKTITSVMTDLTTVNQKYQGTRNTREEIEFLKVLLDCAKRKLAWEKQIASLKRRAPALLEKMSRAMNDNEFPPTDDIRAEMLLALRQVQSALQGLHALDNSVSN